MTQREKRPTPDTREHLPGDAPWRERFPDAELVQGMEGGAIFRAVTPEGSWMILDEGTMVEFLDPEDAVLAGVTIEKYATSAERDYAIDLRLPRAR